MSVTISNDKLALLVHVFPCAVLAFGCFLPHASVAAYSQAAAPCISALPLQARAVCGTVSIQVLCGAGLSYLAVLLGILKVSVPDSGRPCAPPGFVAAALHRLHIFLRRPVCGAFVLGVQQRSSAHRPTTALDSPLARSQCWPGLSLAQVEVQASAF